MIPIIGCRQIGLLVGPCFTILLKHMKFIFLGVQVTVHNSPGLLMAILWIILAFLTVFFFFDLPTSTVSFDDFIKLYFKKIEYLSERS